MSAAGLPRERYGIAALQWEVMMLEKVVESLREGELGVDEALAQFDAIVPELKQQVAL